MQMRGDELSKAAKDDGQCFTDTVHAKHIHPSSHPAIHPILVKVISLERLWQFFFMPLILQACKSMCFLGNLDQITLNERGPGGVFINLTRNVNINTSMNVFHQSSAI